MHPTLSSYKMVLLAAVVSLSVRAAEDSTDKTSTSKPPLTAEAFAAEPPVVTKPVMLVRPTPEYPKELLDVGLRGNVVVDYVVSVEGRATEVQVISTIGEEFSAATLKSLKTATFKPATSNGEPIAMKIRQAFRFEVEETAKKSKKQRH